MICFLSYEVMRPFPSDPCCISIGSMWNLLGRDTIHHSYVNSARCLWGTSCYLLSVSPAEYGHNLKHFFERGVPKSILARFGSISEFRTHKYHQTAQNFETNPMGPVPGSETQISRKKSWCPNFPRPIRMNVDQVSAQTVDSGPKM